MPVDALVASTGAAGGWHVRGIQETKERLSRDIPQWRVKDKLFVWERPLRRADCEALGDSAPDGPILGVRVADVGVKEALLAADPDVYFTTPHFDGYPTILVRLNRIDTAELSELIVEARPGPEAAGKAVPRSEPEHHMTRQSQWMSTLDCRQTRPVPKAIKITQHPQDHGQSPLLIQEQERTPQVFDVRPERGRVDHADVVADKRESQQDASEVSAGHGHVAGDFLDMTQDRQAPTHLAVQLGFTHPDSLRSRDPSVNHLCQFYIDIPSMMCFSPNTVTRRYSLGEGTMVEIATCRAEQTQGRRIARIRPKHGIVRIFQRRSRRHR
jgi:hypothetical protein